MMKNEGKVNAHEIAGDGVVSIRTAQHFTSLGRSTLYELMDNGHLPYVKIGRSRRIPKRALVNLIAENTQGGHRSPTTGIDAVTPRSNGEPPSGKNR